VIDANAAYAHLMKSVWEDFPDNESDFKHVTFTGHEFQSPDAKVSVEPGACPDWLFNVLMHMPYLFNVHSNLQNSEDSTITSEDIQRLYSVAQVLVGDRMACKEGWVLQLAVDHKGRIQSGMRTKALLTMHEFHQWVSLGRGTQYWTDLNDGTEVEWYCHSGTNGWDEAE